MTSEEANWRENKTSCTFSKAFPTGTFHAVCDVIIGDGIWLLRVNIVPAKAGPQIWPLGQLKAEGASSVTDQLFPAIVGLAAPPHTTCMQNL